MTELAFFIDLLPLHRLPVVRPGLRGVRHAQRPVADSPRDDRAPRQRAAPQICVHCEDPICTQVCPADAIKQTPDGIVKSSPKPRCIGRSNCVLTCPFGVPRYDGVADQMMKRWMVCKRIER